MNPCNCSFLGDTANPERCRCTPAQIQRYRSKLSGPLLDRIDMHIEVPRVPQGILTAPSPEDEPTSNQIRQRVEEAQNLQKCRQRCLNSKLSPKQVDEFCTLGSESQNLINSAMLKLGISARGYHRILKLAQSIADLDKSDQIQQLHLAQAIQFRNLDR